MHRKTSLYKWIILLLIPLIGIAFILYRKANYRPKIVAQYVPQEQPTQPVSETPQEPSDNFFNYTEPEDTPIAPEEKTVEVAQPEIKQPPKNPAKVSKKKEVKKQKKSVLKTEKSTAPQEPIKPEKKETKTKKTPTQDKITPAQEKKAIKLIVDMTKKSLAYKYLFIHYSPSKWELKFDGVTTLTYDGKHLNQIKKSISIDPEKPVNVRFDFEFLGGKRLGWKEVMYQIDKNADAIHIDFDWKEPKDDQILISPAKALSKKSHNNHHDGKK